MAKKSTKTQEEPKPWLGKCCRDCAECTPCMKWETLTVKDRQPTLGTCPHEEYKVLLSQKACKEHFKPKKT